MKPTTISKKIIVLSALFLLPLQAAAEETLCSVALDNTVVDNLLVPSNSECVLQNTRIMGTIQVAANAVLTARRIVVIGNVQAENARQVNILDNSRIGGSVQIKQGGGAIISDSIIESDIQFESNAQPFKVLRNDIGGNLQVVQNSGSVEIQYNTIDGNLQCKENSPAPTGGANRVGGNKDDQCARLAGLNAVQENCIQSHPTFDTDARLLIPRLSVVTQDGTVIDYWANLHYVPALSTNDNLVFELRDPASNLGQCN